ncbi:MAG: CBS domain-containing protein [Candidatus Binatia bacterium]
MTREPIVGDIMRRSPVTTTPHHFLADAQELMSREGTHQLPVVENGTLVGMLSDRDLHAHSGYLDRTRVDAAMSYGVIAVSPADTAQHAARVLIERRINAVPVVEQERLIGIVTKTDLLRLLVSVLERLRTGAAA